MEEKKHVCKYCGKEFETGRSLGSHYLHCEQNPNLKNIYTKIGRKKTENAKFKDYTLICEVCGEEYHLTLTEQTFLKGKYKKCCSDKCSKQLTVQHSDVDLIRKHISNSLTNYYKQKQIGRFKIKKCEYCGEEYSVEDRKRSKYCSDECMISARKEKLSTSAKNHNFGGFVEQSVNACHQGWYHGIYCDSSWELAYIIWNELHNNKIVRCKDYVTYFYNNVEYKYYPDFIVNDTQIVEIKGYYSDRARVKHEQHPEILILRKDEMIPIIKEVESLYGKDFIKLYENAG